MFAQRSAVRHAAPAKGTSAKTAGPALNPLVRTLSLHDRIAQMIMVRGYGDYPPSDNAEYKRFLRWIREDHVGGFIVADRIRNGNVITAPPFEMAAFLNHIQRLARTPLLVGSDFERGASMRVADTAKFPYLMAFGAAHDSAALKELGLRTAREAHALGVNWVFAPDSDVNNNPANPIINMRSLGEDPQAVATNVAAFIEGAHSDPHSYVLTTAKHFPGQGDIVQDTHMQLGKLDQPRERLESVEFVPFRSAIEHGVDAIMTAHLAVPAVEPEPIPATVSHNVLTGLLREELHFKGLVVTDALEMQAVTSLFPAGEAAVRAVEAGADVLLMPTDPERSIKAILAAVLSGRIPRRRIDESASKILTAKQRVGLYRSRSVSIDALSDNLEHTDADRLAQRVASEALTLVKDDAHLFPMPSAEGSCLVIMSETNFSQRGELLAQRLQRAAPGVRVITTNADMAASVLNAVAQDTLQCKRIYAAAFIVVAANRGSVSLQGGLSEFLTALMHGPVPLALISMGNPYLLADFPAVPSYLAAFSTTSTSEVAVAEAILGASAIHGRLPVSIPGIAKLGSGLDVAAKSGAASN